MKQKYFLIIFILLSSECLNGKNSIDSTLLNHKKILRQDTLVLKVLNDKIEKANFSLEKNMPWIAAIIVGLLTVLANVIISSQLRKQNKDSLNMQLRNVVDITEKQINNSKDIALAQIENSKKNVQLEFNKTVLSGNRQAWINELRETVSKISANVFSSGLKKDQMSFEDAYEMKFLISKAELMLNVEKDKAYLATLKELENDLFEVITNNKKFNDLVKTLDKVKTETQKTLKTEWERVKRGE